MRIKNRSGKREFKLRAGAGIRGFERSGCENRGEGGGGGVSGGKRDYNFYVVDPLYEMTRFI